ncbi:MAG: hypothetical protein JNJ54_31845 [Myxococcaceae bacterium]|nr:hypothetical protein [Myxococcaceae bacterium]
MRSRIVLVAALAVACAPELPNTPPGEFVVARFDPSAAIPVVPTPNDLVTNPATGLLSVPVPAEASAPDRWFYDWLNTLNGFPAAATASVTFTHALDPATVTASTVRVIDLDGTNAPVDVTRVYSDTTSQAAPGLVVVSPPTGGWTPGHRYAIAIVGGVNGVRGKTGLACVGSATWAFLRNERELIDCPNDDLSSSACRLVTEAIPSSLTEDPARRVADQLATAKRLEPLRRKYKPVVDFFAANGVPRSDLALVWTFRIDDSASFVFDPTAGKIPTPNNLIIKQGLVASPVSPGSSAAAQEWTRSWLNTLNGFPPSTAAGGDIAQQSLDPSTLTERTVRVSVLSGAPLVGPPAIAWNPQLRRLVVTPAGGSWGGARTISIAVIGGASGARGENGKRLAASQVWALVRSAAPLVDCEVLSPSCRSLVKAAPISNEQAIALESLRRTYKPLLDGLERTGIERRDVAGAWIFSTLDQPELVFDPAAAPPRVPTPTDLVVNPTTGLVAAPVPPGASPAWAEFITGYLNTLSGFPVSSTATADFAGDLEPSSVNANTVRVEVLSGGPLGGAPAIAFDAAAGRVTVSPPNGSWGKGRSIAVAVLGGAAGIRSRTGKPLVASQAFSFARLSNSLVDAACTTVGPSCRSVTALSDAQAIGLEPVRRSLSPVLDQLEANGLPRPDIAGLWVFRTVDQPELSFDLAQGVVPFPNNQLLRGNTLPDGGTASGFVVVLPDGGAPGDDATPGVRLSLPIAAGTPASQAQLLAGLNTLDGFSTTAPIVSENSTTLAALDVGGLDAGSLAAASGLLKLDGPPALLPDGGVRLPDVRVCLNCASSLNDAGVLAQPEQLQWVPQTPLDEASRYAAFVTTAARDTQGRAVMAAPTFALVRLANPLVNAAGASTIPVVSDAQAQQLEPVRQRFKGCLDRLEAAGRARRSLALAFCVTTQSVTAPVRALTAGVVASPLPTTVRWMSDVTVATKVSLTAAGVPNAQVGAILEGDLTLPFALTGPSGVFNPNPAQWEARPARFTLTLPLTAAPTGGYPVVLFGHGLTRSRADLLSVANAFATAGLATLGIDTPFHGDRADCRGLMTPDQACADPVNQQCSGTSGRCVVRGPATAAPCDPMSNGDLTCFAASQGRCLPTGACEGGAFAVSSTGNVSISGHRFLDLVNLFATRDHFRHAGAADFAQVARVLSATGAGSLNARLGALTLGALDAAQVHYAGQSLGSFNGAVFAAANPVASRVALNVAGADQVDVLLTAPGFAAERAAFLGTLAASGLTPGTPGFDNFVVLARTILDPADPQNLARAAVDSSNGARRVFVPFVEGDTVLPNAGTTKLLRAGVGAANAGRLSWLQYVAHSGMPSAGRFPASWPAAARHGFLLNPGGAPGSATINPECDSTSMSFNASTCATAVVQAQVAQFLSTGATPANVPVTP